MIKQIFTWWNGQTVGTLLYTLFFGKFVGKDQTGNKYYENRKGKHYERSDDANWISNSLCT